MSSLQSYIKNIYKYTAFGFGGALTTSILFGIIFRHISIMYSIPIWFANLILSFYTQNDISKIKSLVIDYTEIIPQQKKISYAIFSLSLGIIIAPSVSLSFNMNPMIFPIALSTLVGTFFGATYYSNYLDSTWKIPLMTCLSGLFFSGSFHLLCLLLGFTKFLSLFDIIESLVGIVCFTGFIMMLDTNQALTDFKNRNLDSINTSIKLVQDLLNLLIRFIDILLDICDDKKSK